MSHPSRLPRSRTIALCLALAVSSVFACGGGDDDSSIIYSSREDFLAMPSAAFDQEITRLPLPKTRFKHVPLRKVDNDHYETLADASLYAELADLHTALDAAGRKFEYEELAINVAEVRKLAREIHDAVDGKKNGGDQANARIALPDPPLNAHLPAEFRLYLAGWTQHQYDRQDDARKHFRELLALPASKRTFRTVAATYMMGRTYQQSDPAEAITWFIKTRDLVKGGGNDSLGLAAASFGWQARACLDLHQYDNAINLYLVQLATGDHSAVQSLQLTALAAFKEGDDTLKSLAKDTSHRAVLTAFVVSCGGPWQAAPEAGRVRDWLNAIEAADAKIVDGADRLAWSAYQYGHYDLAGRWAARAAQNQPITQWVQAKLLLRDGKIDPAMKLLAAAVRTQEEAAARKTRPQDSEYSIESFNRLHGELGALCLSRSQYAEAMQLLVNSDHWPDAAYIAENVLTADELKAAVDASYPSPAQNDRGVPIRELLARRLMRLGRWKDARPYYSDTVRKSLDDYIAGIRRGHDTGLSKEDRGRALYEAARIMRQNGMHLTGTELGPDSAMTDGGWEDGPPQPRTNDLLASTPDEKQRLARPAEQLDRRFQYRYTAADLAWQAAQLLPDQSNELADVLNRGGSWLKTRDPIAAQRYYEALVTRCSGTVIGKQAIELKWLVPMKD